MKYWSDLSIFDQMGNIYSEVGRSFSAKRRNNKADSDKAVERAIDLFDATTSTLIASKSPKAKEVLRAKEEYLNAIYSDRINIKELDSLDRYFLQFAIAARLTR
jgi:hypothetical protein